MAEPRPDDLEPEGRRRRFDPGSVVTGLFFLFVAAVFLAGGLAGDPVDTPQVIIPAVVVGLGLVGIVRVVTRSRRHR
jgi:NhaP-type Na+/H+ and K+/H+ antiporter